MFHCRTHTWDGDERERRRKEIGWQREGEENFIPLDKDIFNPLSLHCRTHAYERERRKEIGWQREGEENFIPLDKDIFNPLSLHCRTHA